MSLLGKFYQLLSKREAISMNSYAVAVVECGGVGHVPRAMSSVCSLFLRRNSSLVCEVTSTRRRYHMGAIGMSYMGRPCMSWCPELIPGWFWNLHRSTKFAKVFTHERNYMVVSQSSRGGHRNKHCTHGCHGGQIMTIQNCMWPHDRAAKLQVSL